MKYIFWQNFISIHQSAFLESLAKKNDVILIVEEKISAKRKIHGWNLPSLKNIKIIVSPNKNELKNILKLHFNDIHFFSGFDAYHIVYTAFKLAVKYKIKDINIILEPFDETGIKGILRTFKYYYFSIKYKNNIQMLLPSGLLGKQCYLRVGFPKENIFDWGYFTNSSLISNTIEINKKPTLIYVGTIDSRKNILGVLNGIKKYENSFDKFIVIGNGVLIKKFKKSIQVSEKIKYLGNLENNETISIISNCDILILPSLFDGWGAVVNEALHVGTQVIASENCGSSVLLDGEFRGEVFSLGQKGNFEVVLQRWLAKGPLTIEKRHEIAKWSENNISGEVAADYFESIVQYKLGKIKQRPVAPWLISAVN